MLEMEEKGECEVVLIVVVAKLNPWRHSLLSRTCRQFS